MPPAGFDVDHSDAAQDDIDDRDHHGLDVEESGFSRFHNFPVVIADIGHHDLMLPLL